MGIIADSRKKEILAMLKEQGEVTVAELALKFNLSQLTVRRDLDALAESAFVVRIHGGAKAAFLPGNLLGSIREIDFSNKSILNISEKQAIGKIAASYIGDNSTIFMNSGSTTLFFLQALQEKRVQIATNNAAATDVDYDAAHITLYVLGGEFRKPSKSFIGRMTEQAIKSIYSDYTILGTNGIDVNKGLTTGIYEECSTNLSMVEHTLKKVIVLADHSKFGVISNFISIPIDKIDMVITDSKCDPVQIAALEEKGIEVVIA
jgi:DeoR family fructose operon transcriptional repressor